MALYSINHMILKISNYPKKSRNQTLNGMISNAKKKFPEVKKKAYNQSEGVMSGKKEGLN